MEWLLEEVVRQAREHPGRCTARRVVGPSWLNRWACCFKEAGHEDEPGNEAHAFF